MPADTQEPSLTWLLGRERKQRRDLLYWLMTSGVYASLLVVQAYAVTQGLGEGRHAVAMRWAVAFGLAVFYAAMRSGWSQRFADDCAECTLMVSGGHGVSGRWRSCEQVADDDGRFLRIDFTEDFAGEGDGPSIRRFGGTAEDDAWPEASGP